MFLSGVNFILHYQLLKGNFKKIYTNTEFKVYTSIILIIGCIIGFSLFYNHYGSFEKSFRDAFFQVISIITATGFATADYLKWKEYQWVLIFLLMFVGASVGSTGGGIKVMRHIVAVKTIKNYYC
jgi:trk system potassium uptake protein TrkH